MTTMTNQTEQGAALADKPNYHPWSQLSEFEPSGNSGELTDEQADAIARTAFARHTGRTEWEGAQRWVLEAIKTAAQPTPEGYTSVPPGYALVPLEPTDEVIEAVCEIHADGRWPGAYSKDIQAIHRRRARAGYIAALAATPGGFHAT